MPRTHRRPIDPWSDWMNFAESAWDHWFAVAFRLPRRQPVSTAGASVTDRTPRSAYPESGTPTEVTPRRR